LKQEIITEAKKQLTIIQVKIANEAADEVRKRKALEIQAKEKAQNKPSFYDQKDNDTNPTESWSRGSGMA